MGFISVCLSVDNNLSYWLGSPNRIDYHAWITERYDNNQKSRVYYLCKAKTEEEAKQILLDFINRETI